MSPSAAARALTIRTSDLAHQLAVIRPTPANAQPRHRLATQHRGNDFGFRDGRIGNALAVCHRVLRRTDDRYLRLLQNPFARR
jgi:hypothetical protein